MLQPAIYLMSIIDPNKCIQWTSLSSLCSMFTLWSARAPEKNSTEYLRLTNLGVTFDAGEGRSAKAQAGYQIAGLAVALAIAVLGGIVTGNSSSVFFFCCCFVILCIGKVMSWLKINSTLKELKEVALLPSRNICQTRLVTRRLKSRMRKAPYKRLAE